MYNYTDEQKELLGSVLKRYGLEHQCFKMVEECSELIRAISKVYQNDINEYSDIHPHILIELLLSEIVDVEIMLFQIKLSFKDSEKYTDFYESEKIRKFEKISKMMEEN